MGVVLAGRRRSKPATRVMRKWLAFLTAATLLVGGLPAATQAAQLGAMGDVREAAAPLACAGSERMTGAVFRYGHWVDSLQIVCTPFGRDGRPSGAKRVSGKIGGNGGDATVNAECADGGWVTAAEAQVIPAMQLRGDPGGSPRDLIARIKLICTNGQGQVSGLIATPTTAGYAYTSQSVRCLPGQAASGLKVHARGTQWVEGLGLLCEGKPIVAENAGPTLPSYGSGKARTLAVAAAAKSPDCQRPIGRGAEGCLGRDVFVIDSETHQLLRYRKVILPPAGFGTADYGLADEDGRLLARPDYIEITPINARWAYAKGPARGTLLVDLQTGVEKSYDRGINRTEFNGASLIMIGGAMRGEGAERRTDLYLMSRAEQDYRAFPGVRTISRLGPFLILNQMDEERAGQSPRPPGVAQWLDQSGQLVMTTPEMFTANVGGKTAGLVAIAYRAPLGGPVSAAQPFTYGVVDERGQAMTLPNGVVAVAPLTPIEDRNKPFAPVTDWVLVREVGGEREYRVGKGDILDLAKRIDTLMKVDDGQIVQESVKSYIRADEPFVRYAAVREVGKGWALYQSLGGTLQNKRFVSAAESANLFVLTSNAQLDKFAAERAAKEAAAAAADAARRQAGLESWKRLMATRANSRWPDPSLRGALQVAAIQAGGATLSSFLAMYPDAATEDMRRTACQDSALACRSASAGLEANQAAVWARQQAQFEARVAMAAKWNAINNPNPDVRVNIYENGQFRTEVMPRSHYNSIYK